MPYILGPSVRRVHKDRAEMHPYSSPAPVAPSSHDHPPLSKKKARSIIRDSSLLREEIRKPHSEPCHFVPIYTFLLVMSQCQQLPLLGR